MNKSDVRAALRSVSHESATHEHPICQTELEPSAEKKARYWISKNVYVCATINGGVVLDLSKDKYFGMTRGQMGALATVTQGWPRFICKPIVEEPLSDRDANHLADVLLAEGLLTHDKNHAHTPLPATSPSELTMTALGLDWRKHQISLHHVANFLISVVSAVWMLRTCSFQSTVQRVTTRKEQAATLSGAFDAGEAAKLVGIFRRLKSFAYTGRGKCLLDTLVLLNFLSRYGLFPIWVIGVQLQPFRAHSWVQYGSFVLGSTPEETSFSYVPIMTV